MFAAKYQNCEDSAKCSHGTALKAIIAKSDWINLQNVNERKRKKTDKTDDKRFPTKMVMRKMVIVKVFHVILHRQT